MHSARPNSMCSKREENFASLCRLIIKSSRAIALCPYVLKNDEFVCTAKEVRKSRAIICVLIAITSIVIIVDELNYILNDLNTFLRFLDNYTSLAVVCYSLVANYNFHLVIQVIERFQIFNKTTQKDGKLMNYLFIIFIYLLPLCHFASTALTTNSIILYIKCIIACIYYIIYGHLMSLLFLFRWKSDLQCECILSRLEDSKLDLEVARKSLINLNEIERIWGRFFQSFIILNFTTAYIRLITSIFLFILFHDQYDNKKHLANLLTITMHSGAAVAIIIQLSFLTKDNKLAMRYENCLKKDYRRYLIKGGSIFLHVQIDKKFPKMLMPKNKNILLSVIGSMFVNILIMLQFHRLTNNDNFSFKI